MASISLKNVTKIYAGKERAVSDLSLCIGDGEFVVLLGPEGSGKTAVLRMIAGLDKPTEGEVIIGGEPVSGIKTKGRDIAMVFERDALFKNKTVCDNMAYGLVLRKTPPEIIAARVKEAADMFGLESVLNLKPKALSLGQRRRVALARAFVRKPEILLLDEPLKGLDAKARLQTRMDIAKLRHRLASAIVYATSDPVEAMTIGASRIAVLDGGRLLRFCESGELKETLISNE